LFSDAAILDPTYTPAVGETGFVTLILTATAIDPCTLVLSDEVVIFVQPELANVSAGDDASTCEVTAIQLDGTADNYSAVLWTGGLGLFSDAAILDPTYTPAASQAESSESGALIRGSHQIKMRRNRGARDDRAIREVSSEAENRRWRIDPVW
jgi:hypothetical protein